MLTTKQCKPQHPVPPSCDKPAALHTPGLTIKKSTAAFPFLTILCLLFVIGKLTGHFNYSWWTVFSPIWVGPAVTLGCLGAIIALVLGVAFITISCVVLFLISQALRGTWKRLKARSRRTIIER
jgi:hypothetical protein